MPKVKVLSRRIEGSFFCYPTLDYIGEGVDNFNEARASPRRYARLLAAYRSTGAI